MTTAVFIKPVWALIAVCVVGIILFAYLSWKSESNKLKEENNGIRNNNNT